MGGETGALQRLTDEQVKARIAAYNPGGSLDQDIALLRENCTDVIASEVIANFGPDRAERYAKNSTTALSGERSGGGCSCRRGPRCSSPIACSPSGTPAAARPSEVRNTAGVRQYPTSPRACAASSTM